MTQSPSTTLSVDFSGLMPRCLGCDYSLYNLTIPRCPECGKTIRSGQSKNHAAALNHRPNCTSLATPRGQEHSCTGFRVASVLMLLGYPYSVDSIVPLMGSLGVLGEIIWIAILLYWLGRVLLANFNWTISPAIFIHSADGLEEKMVCPDPDVVSCHAIGRVVRRCG